MDVKEDANSDGVQNQILNIENQLKLKYPDNGLSPLEALDIAFQEYSPNTRRAYSHAFLKLQEWANIRQLSDLESFDTMKLLAYKQKMRKEGRKPATINLHLSAIKKIADRTSLISPFKIADIAAFASSLEIFLLRSGPVAIL